MVEKESQNKSANPQEQIQIVSASRHQITQLKKELTETKDALSFKYQQVTGQIELLDQMLGGKLFAKTQGE